MAGIVGLVTTHLARQAIDEHNNTPFDPHSPWASVAVLLASGLVASLFNLYFQVSHCQPMRVYVTRGHPFSNYAKNKRIWTPSFKISPHNSQDPPSPPPLVAKGFFCIEFFPALH